MTITRAKHDPSVIGPEGFLFGSEGATVRKRRLILVAAAGLVMIVLLVAATSERRLYFDRSNYQVIEWRRTLIGIHKLRIIWHDRRIEADRRRWRAELNSPEETLFEVHGKRVLRIDRVTDSSDGKLTFEGTLVSEGAAGSFEKEYETSWGRNLDSLESLRAEALASRPPGSLSVSAAWMPLADERFVEVFKLVETARDSRDASLLREKTEQLLREFPNDPVAVMCAVDAAIFAREALRVQSLVDQCEPVLRDSPVGFHRASAARYREWLAAYAADVEGRNIVFLMAEDGTIDQERIGSGVLERPVYYDLNRGALLPIWVDVPSTYFNFQILSKVRLVSAEFQLVSGDVEGADRALSFLQVLRLGLMRPQVDTIGPLVGCAISAYASSGYNLVLLNGCRTNAQLHALWPQFHAQHRALEAVASEVPASLAKVPEWRTEGLLEHYPNEYLTRCRHAVARNATVHTAAAARYELLAKGDFPASTNNWTLLPEGPDADPFGKGLLQARREDDEYIVYSVGPDVADDRAAIEYDPTNGTVSSGDITARFGRTPKYPFPAPGELPRTRDEILAHFPAGLPVDPFADTRFMSLIINDETPPLIWSVGPDCDEAQQRITPGSGIERSWSLVDGENPLIIPRSVGVARTGSEMHFYSNNPYQPPYDATNGTTSQGNIYWRVGTKPPQ